MLFLFDEEQNRLVAYHDFKKDDPVAQDETLPAIVKVFTDKNGVQRGKNLYMNDQILSSMPFMFTTEQVMSLSANYTLQVFNEAGAQDDEDIDDVIVLGNEEINLRYAPMEDIDVIDLFPGLTAYEFETLLENLKTLHYPTQFVAQRVNTYALSAIKRKSATSFP